MTAPTLADARRELLSCLRTLESSERALSRVMPGPCDAEMQAYVADVRRARAQCEALERLLIAELELRETGR